MYHFQTTPARKLAEVDILLLKWRHVQVCYERI